MPAYDSQTDPHRDALVHGGFGKNLVALRKERRLTQAELAELLDQQPRLLGRWERGQTGARPDTFEIRNRKLKELCKRVDKLAEKDQEVICRFLDMAVRHHKRREIVGGPFRAAS